MILEKVIAVVALASIGLMAFSDGKATIKGKVYYGTKDEFDPARKPAVAVVDSRKVYREIPAYKVILKEGIKKGTARYSQLMYNATLTFKSAVVRTAEGKYQFVVEVGGVKGYPVKDITQVMMDSV